MSKVQLILGKFGSGKTMMLQEFASKNQPCLSLEHGHFTITALRQSKSNISLDGFSLFDFPSAAFEVACSKDRKVALSLYIPVSDLEICVCKKIMTKKGVRYTRKRIKV